LGDSLAVVYEEIGEKLFKDPWLARDEYVAIIGDSRPLEKVQQFLTQHQAHELTEEEQIDALRLLEMQRHCLLMYTSCGWFFDELSRPEGVQIMRYASRAMELAGELGEVHHQSEFISRLAEAPSNVADFENGAEVYKKLVIPSQVNLEQVAAHYAISSLFSTYSSRESIHCYTVEQIDYHKQHIGTMSLAVGQVKLTSKITLEHQHFTFAALHLGGWDFHCCIKPFLSRLSYTEIKNELFEVFKQASAAQNILVMNRLFSDRHFSLQDLFAEERHRVMSKLTENTKKRLNQLYTQVYRENYSILLAFYRENLTIPQELQVAAEVALTHRAQEVVLALETAITEPVEIDLKLKELQAIAIEADHLNCKLNLSEARVVLEQLILRLLWQLLYNGDPDTSEADVKRLENIIQIGNQLNLGLYLGRAQEVYFSCLKQKIVPDCIVSNNTCRWNVSQLKPLLKLGSSLGINVSNWLK
jgi:alpha-amylase/alpha-mannosidase (GH57 family)